MHSMCHKMCTHVLCVHVSACMCVYCVYHPRVSAVHVLDRFLYIYFKAGECMYIDQLRFSSTCPLLLPASL